MRERLPAVWTAACGILGVLALVASFNVNPGPPANASIAQIVDFGKQYHDSILVGAWLQGVGSLLNVVFVLALVHLAGYGDRFAGRLTLLAGVTILNVSLVEIAFYLTAVQSGESGDLTAMATSLQFIKGVQHVFLIAPALLLPVGLAILGSPVLPQIFGFLAIALSAALEILGFVGLFNNLQPVIDVVLIVQEVWMLAAAVALLLRGAASRPALSPPLAATTST
jgi:hypothetical protein